MPSMASPFSNFFSISTMSLTPSTTICTCCTSEEPRRSALEMSKIPPTEAVSTPPAEFERSSYLCRASADFPGWRGRSARSRDARST
uniref:Uncharacterized protein n=1 Tax=Salmo trutta TaxID=8032 RepID=A0A673ZVQ6_SALTR